VKNGIYLVATPIGNVRDISLRALDVLDRADIVACEDTRVTKKLFSLLNLSMVGKKFVAIHNYNESDEATELLDKAENNVIAYVSDAGSPLISDPGYKLARMCRQRGIFLTVVPGACAAICGLQLSGLPTNTFMFAGFVPNKDKARRDFVEKYRNVETTLIFYETAARLRKTLEIMIDAFKDREIAVVREITKVFEECQCGNVEYLMDYYATNPLKGEIVLVVGPLVKKMEVDFVAELKEEMKKSGLKTSVKLIVEKYNLNKNEVYKKALELKND